MKSTEKLLLIFLVCYHPEIRTYACLFTFYSLLHTQCLCGPYSRDMFGIRP